MISLKQAIVDLQVSPKKIVRKDVFCVRILKLLYIL